MAVYNYTRSSIIEALEAKSEIQSVIDKENLHMQTFALREGMNIMSSFIDEDVKWAVDFEAREKGKGLISTLESGDIVLAFSIERIFSSCEDMYRTLKTLQSMKVRLMITSLDADLTDPGYSPSFLEVVKLFHNLEKRRSTERIKTVKRNQRDQGRFLGGSRPFGYMIHSNGRLIENPMEQRVLRRILRLKQEGKSLRAISSEVSTPVIPVSFKTVQRLIKRHESDSSVN